MIEKWSYPLETFFWTGTDANGNSQIEIRDAKKRTCFFVGIKGHEYNADKALKHEIAPLIARLLNEHVSIPSVQSVQEEIPIVVSTNGEEPIEEKVVELTTKRGRGRPRKNV